MEHPSEKWKEREVDLPDAEFEVLPMASTPEVSEPDEDLPLSHQSSSSIKNIPIDVSCQSSGGSDIPIDSDPDLDQSEASSEGVSVFFFAFSHLTIYYLFFQVIQVTQMTHKVHLAPQNTLYPPKQQSQSFQHHL